MAKESISNPDLLKKVQNIISKSPECRNIHIDSIQVYSEQVNGANWDVTNLRCSGDDNDLEECCETIMSDIRALRDRFDVLECESV